MILSTVKAQQPDGMGGQNEQERGQRMTGTQIGD
jgi:hypothetical protein